MKDTSHPRYILSCPAEIGEDGTQFSNSIRTPEMINAEVRKNFGIQPDAKGKTVRQLRIFSSYPGQICTLEQMENVFWHCKNKDENLIIDRNFEPNLLWDGAEEGSRSIFDIIHHCIEKTNFDYKRVFLIVGSLDADTTYKNYANHKNIPEDKQLRVYASDYWLEQFRQVWANDIPIHYIDNRDYNDPAVLKYKTKYFTCFNGRVRPNKCNVAVWMFKNGFFTDPDLKDKHLSSFVFQNTDKDYEFYVENPGIYEVLPRSLEKTLAEWDTLSYQDLQTEEYELAQMTGFFDVVVDFVQNEDWVDYNKFLQVKNKNPWWSEKIVSEKVYRNLFTKRPFITISEPGMLKYLNDIGFKTFPFLFDESYDSITDYNLRYRAVLSQVKKIIKNKTLDEIKDIIYSDQCQEVLHHNRDHGVKIAEEYRHRFASKFHRFMFE